MTMFPVWDARFPDPRIKACFFGAINVGRTAPDQERNRRACMTRLAQSDVPLITPFQYHSNVCLYTTSSTDAALEGDALVTDQPDLAIGVVTADCAPLLFAGQKEDGASLIGACHAGARGALKGVIQSTLAVMRTHGAKGINGFLGPCIHSDSYEVGPEFYEEFTTTDPVTVPCFVAQENGKYLFDLPRYVAHILRDEAVPFEQIMVDTYTNDDTCFSYRRATHRGEPDYGRQLSAIMISDAIP